MRDAAANTECSFIRRGDFNDCAHAGGGRGAKDEWCDSCKAVYRPSVPEVRADEPFGTVEGGIPLPESMKGVTLIDAKDVPPPTLGRGATPCQKGDRDGDSRPQGERPAQDAAFVRGYHPRALARPGDNAPEVGRRLLNSGDMGGLGTAEERPVVVFVTTDNLLPLPLRARDSWLVKNDGLQFERVTEDGETYQRMIVIDRCPTCRQKTAMKAGPWRTIFGKMP